MVRQQIALFSLLVSLTAFAGSVNQPKNKLIEMFKFFYLPFKIDFQVGQTTDEVIPVRSYGTGTTSVVSPEEMQTLDKTWKDFRSDWKRKSLFQDSFTAINSDLVISPHLIGHRIRANRGALDTVPIETRIQLKALIQGKSKEIQSMVLQKQFVRSLIGMNSPEIPHFFIVAPDWCASSDNYRTIIETYSKKFAMTKFVLHSVVIEDPNEQIFDSRAMMELFPNSNNFSHENVPRFIFAEQTNGDLQIYQEGEALSLLYNRFFATHQGFLEETPSKQNLPSTLSKLSVK